MIGFAGALAPYVLVSLLATGILTRKELVGLKAPSMAGVLESIVGPWGAALISIGLVVSVGGAFLSWTLLCAEIPYTCAKDVTFPRWFAAENASGSPKNSLWATNLLIQIFLILSCFSKDACHFFYFNVFVAILPSYVLLGDYAFKLTLFGETHERNPRSRNREAVGAIATIYGLWPIYASGLSYLLRCAMLFVPGILVYAVARRERGQHVFAGVEGLIAAALVGCGPLAAWLIWNGTIGPL